jgi:hypothetical protein
MVVWDNMLEASKLRRDSTLTSELPIAPPSGAGARDSQIHDSASAALNLGWWMAEAFHYADRRGRLLYPDRSPEVPAALANLNKIQPRDRLRMYIDGIDVHLMRLARIVPDAQNAPPTEPARAGLKALDTANNEAADHLLIVLNGLHIDLLTWLQATDRRLGMAYGLGRSLFMTTRNHEAHLDKLRAQFAERVIEIRKWLDQLASALPPYSAGVVRHSLGYWTHEVRTAAKAPDSQAILTKLARRLPDQGDIWRGLLSGDLDGRVLLDSDDYADIAERLAMDNRRLLGLLSRRILLARPAKDVEAHAESANSGRRHGLPLIVYLTGAMSAVLIVSVFAATGSPTVRVAAALLALAGGAISIWKTVSQPLNAAMRTVNRPLYDAQLTVHVARRISWPLDNAKRGG